MLILASASEARQSLLTQAGVNFQVIVSNVVESEFDFPEITQLVQELSFAKAEEVIFRITNRTLENHAFDNSFAVLGCDSLFEFKGEILGKPSNKEEAFTRWKRMSSEQGILHTGHTLFYRSFEKKENRDIYSLQVIKGVVSTAVFFEELSDEEISNYLDTDEALKCAGGFAIDGKASLYIKKIDGCFSNVIGLSLPWLKNALKNRF